MADRTAQPDTDVVVVGYGPVGMSTAALLARAGHRVTVLERYPGMYNLPRAAIFDDETMRTWAVLGIADELLPTVRVQRSYEWRNGAGDLLIEHHFAERGRSGWAEWYMMYQPALEAALDRLCRAGGVELRHGSPVTGLVQEGDRVRVTTADGSEATASFVVACDGGNSFVRSALGVAEDDYGFSEPWMVCDFRFRRPAQVPTARQVGDPRRPTSIISLGPDHHRFSFMLDSVDDFAHERAPERVWARVAGHLTPDDAELIRVATYTFRSRVAHRWRVGRVLLAGDAAHQMPPFLGQGMCSGVRDAQNLAFRLDLVLRGRRGADVLDGYQTEREPHVRAVIEKGIELGRRQTVRDPELAAARDRELLARRAAATTPERIVFPGLGPGMLAPGGGALSVQGRVLGEGGTALLDQAVGGGWHLIADGGAELPERELAEAGVRVLRLGPDADVDGTYQDWLTALGASAVAVRPDFYVYGTAGPTTGADLARRLLADLGAPEPALSSPARRS